MSTFRDQIGNDFISSSNTLPPPGSTVTLPNGTGQTGNATWTGSIAVPNPPPTKSS